MTSLAHNQMNSTYALKNFTHPLNKKAKAKNLLWLPLITLLITVSGGLTVSSNLQASEVNTLQGATKDTVV